MPRDMLTDEQVEMEIERLSNNDFVKLARAEQREKYKRRQYLYSLRHLEKRGKEALRHYHRQHEVIEFVVFVNVSKEAGDYRPETVTRYRPGCVLAARSRTEIFPCNQDLVHSLVRCFAEFGSVEDERLPYAAVRGKAPVPEEIVPEETLVTGSRLEETGRNNLVSINVFERERHHSALYYIEFLFHNNSLGSVTTPHTAAAAAVSGLASIVREPGP